MQVEILTYLRLHPDATCADIAFALGQRPAYVSTEIRLLKKDGKIVITKGNTRGMRYRVAPGVRVAGKAGTRG
jgi:DNA-binding MarR family transcriptional regulator